MHSNENSKDTVGLLFFRIRLNSLISFFNLLYLNNDNRRLLEQLQN